ncbi:hypothetical protein SNL152K_1367 [Streptomyces sp. NL15-2K]|nr:hypothetical protein SNL152K_1367 [Streptomyces sp. NL15-2K]
MPLPGGVGAHELTDLIRLRHDRSGVADGSSRLRPPPVRGPGPRPIPVPGSAPPQPEERPIPRHSRPLPRMRHLVTPVTLPSGVREGSRRSRCHPKEAKPGE